MSDFHMLIDGGLSSGTQQMEVINPATGKAFAFAPRATELELGAAVKAARAAFPAWSSTSELDRREVLRSMAAALEGNADDLARLFTKEQGRPTEGALAEITMAAGWFKALAETEIPVDVLNEAPNVKVVVHHEPLGVIAAIVPWNFPINLAVWKIAPALLTGNTLVLKPSPYTPLTMLRFGELIKDIVPAGVLNIITGGDELGPWMTAHPDFDKISFTGSTATGRKVMEAAARDLKRVTLELGGNDAAIVMDDVNVDVVAPALFFGAFFNSAQICVATKRLYVHAKVYDDLLDRLIKLAKGSKVGDGSQQGVAFGPVQNKVQYDRVQELLANAEQEGLAVIKCGDIPVEGYFIPLTIVDNPPEDSRVVQEEAFGPILPLIKFDDVEDVISRANDSEYGLAGAVWSNDVERALDVAKRLDTGTVWINQNLTMLPGVPFAGRRGSGVGVENGREGLLEFTQRKAIYVPVIAGDKPALVGG